MRRCRLLSRAAVWPVGGVAVDYLPSESARPAAAGASVQGRAVQPSWCSRATAVTSGPSRARRGRSRDRRGGTRVRGTVNGGSSRYILRDTHAAGHCNVKRQSSFTRCRSSSSTRVRRYVGKHRIETTSDALDQIKTTRSNVMLRNRLIVAMHSQIRSMINVHG